MNNNWKARQARAILLAMSQKEVTQAQLSRTSGVSREMLHKFLSQHINISLDTLSKLLGALDIDVEPRQRELFPLLDPMLAKTGPATAQAAIGTYLGAVADGKGLTIEEIAEQAGLMPSTVECILYNRGEYYFSEFVQVSRVLNLHLDLSERPTTRDLGAANN